jgi:uncharacterized membrane protein
MRMRARQEEVMRGIVAAVSGAAIGFTLVRRARYVKAYTVVDAEQVVTIRRPADALYAMWMKREQWWRWMRPVMDAQVSAKSAREIAFRAPGTLEGSVTFVELENGRGTEVRLRVRHVPKVMPFSVLVAGYRGLEPTARLKEDLRRFKQLAECGEVASNESPSARRKGKAEVGTTTKRAIDVATTVKNVTIEEGAR